MTKYCRPSGKPRLPPPPKPPLPPLPKPLSELPPLPTPHSVLPPPSQGGAGGVLLVDRTRPIHSLTRLQSPHRLQHQLDIERHRLSPQTIQRISSSNGDLPMQQNRPRIHTLGHEVNRHPDRMPQQHAPLQHVHAPERGQRCHMSIENPDRRSLDHRRSVQFGHGTQQHIHTVPPNSLDSGRRVHARHMQILDTHRPAALRKRPIPVAQPPRRRHLLEISPHAGWAGRREIRFLEHATDQCSPAVMLGVSNGPGQSGSMS